MSKAFVKIFLSVWMTILLLFLSCASQAESVVCSDVTYHSAILNEPVSWTFEYSDHWFEGEADTYSHLIARASLGLACAGFRSKADAADKNIVAHLNDLGFSDLGSWDYDLKANIDTIGTVIAHKQLPSGETLLAVSISGQGYQDEWLSNFDIGNEKEHRGFSSAAQKVEQRVEEYIRAHGLVNPRLWMAGFSRAAAVANLAGAHLLEKGLFDEKNAFIYTFASPRTTRNPVAYANIFNIVGKFDPVTKMPYAEWGLDRHGTVFYTPAQETDSDYCQLQAAADIPFYELTGVHMWNSTVVNHHLSVIESYLLSSIPTAADYDAYMGEYIAAAWMKPDLSAVLTVLGAMAGIDKPGNPSGESSADLRNVESLVNYALSMFMSVDEKDFGGKSVLTSDKIALSASIMMEHMPEVYTAWMFSSEDPEQVFSDKTQYMQLVISGDADVCFFDQKGGFIMSMAPDGTVQKTTDNPRYQSRMRPIEERPELSAWSTKDRRVFILPKDQGIPFTMTARSESALQYYAIYYDISKGAPTMSSVREIHMEEGEEYLAFSLTPFGQGILQADEPLWGDADVIARVFDPDQLLTVSDVAAFGNMNHVDLSVRHVIRKVGIFLCVVIILVLALLYALIRLLVFVIRRTGVLRKKHKRLT